MINNYNILGVLSLLVCVFPWVYWYFSLGKFIFDCLMTTEDVEFDPRTKHDIIMWFSITTGLVYFIL